MRKPAAPSWYSRSLARLGLLSRAVSVASSSSWIGGDALAGDGPHQPGIGVRLAIFKLHRREVDRQQADACQEQQPRPVVRFSEVTEMQARGDREAKGHQVQGRHLAWCGKGRRQQHRQPEGGQQRHLPRRQQIEHEQPGDRHRQQPHPPIRPAARSHHWSCGRRTRTIGSLRVVHRPLCH